MKKLLVTGIYTLSALDIGNPNLLSCFIFDGNSILPQDTYKGLSQLDHAWRSDMTMVAHIFLRDIKRLTITNQS